jgi:multiple sugar transport system substrate-binding protein
VEDVTWDGERFGIPLDTNALVLMFNADHFTAANIAPPGDATTFADLERMAAALSRPDGSQRALVFPTSNWWTYGWIRANGGEVVETGPDGEAKVTLDAPKVVEAVRFLAGLIQRGYAFAPRAVTSHSGDALALFRSGNASMHASGSWDLATLEREDPSGRYRPALLPKGAAGGAPGSVLGGSSLYVGKGSRHRTLAFEFMLHLTSDRYALRFAREQGRLPARRRVFEDSYFQTPELQVFVRQLESAHAFRLEAFPQARQALETALDEALRQGHDPAATLHQAQEKAEAAPAQP